MPACAHYVTLESTALLADTLSRPIRMKPTLKRRHSIGPAANIKAGNTIAYTVFPQEGKNFVFFLAKVK